MERSEQVVHRAPYYHPYSKGIIVFKFGSGVLVGIAIAPVARPYISRKLDDLALKLRVMAAEAKDRGYTSHTGA